MSNRYEERITLWRASNIDDSGGAWEAYWLHQHPRIRELLFDERFVRRLITWSSSFAPLPISRS